MTRDYNKSPRDDTRSSSRGQSPNRAGDDRSPRPPRPRLSRETVDRAWESGAPAQHADYRTRSSNGQPSRWRNNQQSEHSPAQYGRRPNGTYGNQQGNQRSFERTPNGNYGSRPRSFDTGRERYDNQRSSFGNERPGNAGGFQKNDTRGGSSDNQQRQARDQRPPFRDGERNRGYQGRRTEGQPQSQSLGQGPRDYKQKPRDFERDERPQRSYERKPRAFEQGERPQRRYGDGNRPSYPAGQPDTQNPRWQSRPAAQRDTSPQKRPDSEGQEAEGGLFEGDYEQFGAAGTQRSGKPGRPYRGAKTSSKTAAVTRTEPEERHVTRLPDGRVLKGPRTVQRKEAQFWTGIADETEDLLKQIEILEGPETAEVSMVSKAPDELLDGAVQESSADVETGAKAVRKPRSRAASTIARNKKDLKKEKAVKPRSSGPRPSQRGYKWPTPESSE
jgi:hypothetical protein